MFRRTKPCRIGKYRVSLQDSVGGNSQIDPVCLIQAMEIFQKKFEPESGPIVLH